MPDGYSLQTAELNKKLKEQAQEIEKLINCSNKVSSDLVKYVLRQIRSEENFEICRILTDHILKRKLPLAVILKIVVKLLFLLKTSSRYEHNGFYTAKNIIDDVLDKANTTTAKLAKKKYQIILNNMLKEGVSLNKSGLSKQEAIEDIKDSIARGYIKFI